MNKGQVFLIPSILHEDGYDALPAYLVDAVKKCQALFVENERSARRYLKKIYSEIVIDDYRWFTIHKAETEVLQQFIILLKEGNNIGIISEAGCPGIADPGQLLVEAAQKIHAEVKPLTGPSSVLLALMASGMNGQRFQFLGYLPIDNLARKKALKEIENESLQKGITQIFIETPYRNNQLLKDIVDTCGPKTRLCIAVDVTASTETIRTMYISEWKNALPDIHKRTAIFLIHAA